MTKTTKTTKTTEIALLTRDEVMLIANETVGKYWMDEAHIQVFARRLIEITVNKCIGGIGGIGGTIKDSNSHMLVPIEPTEAMLKAACNDGIIVDGKPVWKRGLDFQAKWKYQTMLEAYKRETQSK